MLTRLFKKLFNKNQVAEQKGEQPENVKKPTLTEQLGLPFGLNEIEYISIIHQDLDEPMYYIAISNREKLKILTHTHTTSKNQIIARLEDLTSYFKPFGNYVNLGEGLPLINLPQIDFAELIWEEHDENDNRRNHCIIGLSNGQNFHTKSEISTADSINYNEWLSYTFNSARNDRLHGK